MSETLSSQYAQVTHDGSIFWSRPGRLAIACRFSGLVAFPFDSLGCAFEIGGWATSGIDQGLLFEGAGFTLDYEQKTSGESCTCGHRNHDSATHVSYVPFSGRANFRAAPAGVLPGGSVSLRRPVANSRPDARGKENRSEVASSSGAS